MSSTNDISWGMDFIANSALMNSIFFFEDVGLLLRKTNPLTAVPGVRFGAACSVHAAKEKLSDDIILRWWGQVVQGELTPPKQEYRIPAI